MSGVVNPTLRTLALGTLLLTSIVAVALMSPGPAPTSVTGLFELGPAQGADILCVSPDPPPDWGCIFDGNGNVANLYGGLAAAFEKDQLSQSSSTDWTTFSGAGTSNKNDDPVSCPTISVTTCWHWDTGNVPAKDDFSNGYAWAKIDPANGHLIVYAGFERLDPSGDSHVDLEFFQNQVALDEAPPCNDPGISDPYPCNFVGSRMAGDIIVSMDFTVGGSLGSVTVREWTGTTYTLVGSVGGEGCNSALTLCGFNNGGNIDGGPWPNYDRHGSEITTLPRNSFTEFGADVTALSGGSTPCISTFMGKTRSSQSFTAELKDFAQPVPFPICGASIQIFPNGVNEVRQPHTFTVTVFQLTGGAPNPAPDGTPVTVTLTSTNGALAIVSSNTCASNPGTIAGSCSVTFTSNSAGTVTGHAAADLTIGAITFHVETDGEAPNSGDAVKIFVDGSITIGPPLDTNSIQETHTFTVNVRQNIGDGNGFVNVADGTIVTVTLTPTGGATIVDVVDNCASPGTVSGTCTVTFTSLTTGTVTGHAASTFSVLGVSIHRETNGVAPNSGDAVKIFVAGSLRWTKVDNANRFLAGATFEVCRTANYNSGTGTFDPITPVCVSVTDNVAPDSDSAGGKFLLVNLRLGRYTVQETAAPPGFQGDLSIGTVELSQANPDGVVGFSFVNQRPIVKITGFGYSNQAVGTPTDGVVTGHTVFTFSLKNYGGAGAFLSGGLSVTFSNPAYFTCTPGSCIVDLSGILLGAGAELTFSLSVDYVNAPSGSTVTANLNVQYTLNGLTRTASGSPAMIMFTIQGG
ncbi:MAG: hypothetical protein E6K10_02725 [Methanobacteriota archaeon]|nr:MAG: hypothetical protein E6K10_02725 [Euryarchaeota archaeon]